MADVLRSGTARCARPDLVQDQPMVSPRHVARPCIQVSYYTGCECSFSLFTVSALSQRRGRKLLLSHQKRFIVEQVSCLAPAKVRQGSDNSLDLSAGLSQEQVRASRTRDRLSYPACCRSSCKEEWLCPDQCSCQTNAPIWRRL